MTEKEKKEREERERERGREEETVVKLTEIFFSAKHRQTVAHHIHTDRQT
jgi:hypothetical protein